MNDALTPLEALSRGQEALLENALERFSLGPYTVRPNEFALTKKDWPYCVYDKHNRAVVVGTREECDAYVERFDTMYARHIMLKDIKPKDEEVAPP